jgi:hypothetical protein
MEAVVCSVVSGTIFEAWAIFGACATTNSMNALTSGRDMAFALGYMNSGRERGLYEPFWMASTDGLVQVPLPSSTPTRLSLSAAPS